MHVLLQHGADVNGSVHGNWTPLHLACALGHVGIASALVHAGADMGAYDMGWRMPLDIAKQRKRLKVTAKLEELSKLSGPPVCQMDAHES